MTDPTHAAVEAKLPPCPFCGEHLFFNGNKMNAYGRCETEGCWMHERKCTVPLDDLVQVAAWSTRAHPAPEASAGGVIQADADRIRAVAAAIYAEDDVWQAAFPYETLDEGSRSAYERIARAAISASLAHAPGFDAARDRAVEARDKLRRALIIAGRAAGCVLADDVSDEFLCLVPAEIAALAAIQPQGERGEGV